MHVVGPFSEALRSTIQPCTFLLLAPVMLVVVAARLRLQAVIAAFGAGILGGWVFADNTFVLDGWWLRLSALPVLGVFVGLAIPAVGDRFPRLRGTTAGALGTGFVTAGATLWWRPCVGNELGTILTDAQSGVVGQMLPMAAYMIGALTPVAAVALAHRVWEPDQRTDVWLGWGALLMALIVSGSILVGRHDQIVVALTRWTVS